MPDTKTQASAALHERWEAQTPRLYVAGTSCAIAEFFIVGEAATDQTRAALDARLRLAAAAPEMLAALKGERRFRIAAQNFIARFHAGEFGLASLEHHLTGLFTGSDTEHVATATDAALAAAEGA